jgi:hypothetical protein
VLALTEEAIGAAKAWKDIAMLLNAAGLKPPRGQAFDPGQIRLLYLREHKLTTFKLPERADTKETSA